jgi:hypothetical protein
LNGFQKTLQVSHPNGTLLLRHRFELLRKVEGNPPHQTGTRRCNGD